MKRAHSKPTQNTIISSPVRHSHSSNRSALRISYSIKCHQLHLHAQPSKQRERRLRRLQDAASKSSAHNSTSSSVSATTDGAAITHTSTQCKLAQICRTKSFKCTAFKSLKQHLLIEARTHITIRQTQEILNIRRQCVDRI